MACVGDEAPALPLVIVQTLGEHIKFVAQLRKLVLAPGDHTVLVVAAGHNTHGVGEGLQLVQHHREVETGNNKGATVITMDTVRIWDWRSRIILPRSASVSCRYSAPVMTPLLLMGRI